MRAVVLAGGQGARLTPYTRVIPKPLIPLDDMPILQIILMQMRACGVTQVTLSVAYKAHLIQSYFGNGEWLGIPIDYSLTSHVLGTAGPLKFVESLDEPFLVMNADLLTTVDFADVIAAHRRSKAIGTVVLCRQVVDVSYGVVNVDSQHHVTGYVEKPKMEFLISAGVFAFNPEVLHYIPHGQFMDMPDLFQQLLADGHTINGYQFDGDWLDIGTPSQYERGEALFQQHRSRYLKDEYSSPSFPKEFRPTNKIDAPMPSRSANLQLETTVQTQIPPQPPVEP